ncbi:sensor histidine kinase [Dactylosporangium sp. NPDC005572]|uniref:sensor histidine kinase n=1 Tax=Dactylosporangium sp. NPDC005572 TaxID=3156889 RepID=UPI0033A7E51D
MSAALDGLCALARDLTRARSAHVLDASPAVVASAGPSVDVDLDLAARILHRGLPAAVRRTLYVPVDPGLLVVVGRRRAPRPREVAPFGPLARTLLAECAGPVRERERLARDLHDSVVQTLYGISLGAGTAAELMHGNLDHAQESLAWIQETAAAGLTDLRGIILRLRPETLVGAGLATALKGLFETLHAVPGRDGWGLQLDADPVVSPEVEETLYRIALEALGNAARHAGASQVTLRLAGDDTHVVLEVIDDGVGFVLDGPHPGRLGVRSMRERAALVGGRLEIDTAPGAGTVVRAALPAG